LITFFWKENIPNKLFKTLSLKFERQGDIDKEWKIKLKHEYCCMNSEFIFQNAITIDID